MFTFDSSFDFIVRWLLTLVLQYLNSIVAMFGGLISNTPGAMFGYTGKANGRIVHQFSTYGQVHLLLIQAMKKGSGQNEKLDLFAHAMAECDGETPREALSINVC